MSTSIPPSSVPVAPADPASGLAPAASAPAGASALSLERAAQQQPDGPNVAPSPWERAAAQGVLPAVPPDGAVPAVNTTPDGPPPSIPTQGETAP